MESSALLHDLDLMLEALHPAMPRQCLRSPHRVCANLRPPSATLPLMMLTGFVLLGKSEEELQELAARYNQVRGLESRGNMLACRPHKFVHGLPP